MFGERAGGSIWDLLLASLLPCPTACDSLLNLHPVALAFHQTYFTYLFQEAHLDSPFHWLWVNTYQFVRSVSIYRYLFYSFGFSKHGCVLFQLSA